MTRRLFDAAHGLLRYSAAAHSGKDMAPHVGEWDEAGVVDRSAFKAAGRSGFPGMAAPTGHDGVGCATSPATRSSPQSSTATGLPEWQPASCRTTTSYCPISSP
ncbi:acyl-CoA dehydrogenase family protein [Streptomyces spiralis]